MTTATHIHGQPVAVQTVNYSGHTFSDFHARRDHTGPGWYVFGRNSTKYGTKPDGTGAYVMLCAYPDKPARRFRNYNRATHAGWPTKRQAAAVAAALNAK
jgi:hypothetical protein